ncbi:MAG: hypothetical protein A2908_02840 [Candidatus Staskawiczbacteria bacterium RIFCSPLOWO2_01_FULL_38_12b]|uniref:Uncharacterized protein n=1 Tax=Candidatus Staskawiczbacteria bacterium RIFCSPLOWO2_01_FULL_38_12b TaxID=1802214 RepID=A0A1G2ICZ5_9BACT|nr:MAG: hypothetical protein A2908_02840 [Candidatus Staskawiczbacteria bacterium RIFCSPLOWO2_01_FULL_38_12b]
MWLSQQRRKEIILDAVEKATKLKKESKEEKRWKRYQALKNRAKKEIDSFDKERFLVRCKECDHWCIINGKDQILWPMSYGGKLCPMCGDWELTSVTAF